MIPSSPVKLALGGYWVIVSCSKGRKIRELGVVSPKDAEDSLVREGSKEKARKTVIFRSTNCHLGKQTSFCF